MTPRVLLPALALLSLTLALAPAPSAATDGGEHAVTAPPWVAGYAFGFENEDGWTINYKVGGKARLPEEIGDGTSLLLIEERGRPGAESDVVFHYLDPQTRHVLGRVSISSDDEAMTRTVRRYEPPLDVFGFPFAPGDAWTVNSTEHYYTRTTYYDDPGNPREASGQGGRWRAEYTVGQWTTVETPFGAFDALPVTERPLDQVSRAQRKTLVRPFAPEAYFHVAVEDHRGEHGRWRTYNMTTLRNNLPPVATLNASTLEAYKGAPIRFDASRAYDVDDGIVARHWNLGDGNRTDAIAHTHAYATPGRYNVTLTVEDARGATTNRTVAVTVMSRRPIPVVEAPRAVQTGVPFNVSAADSADPDGGIVAFAWDFGDGTTARGAEANHTYAQPGRYAIRLAITDTDGVTSRARVAIQVGNASGASPDGGVPDVRITAPADGATVSGPTNITWNLTGRATVAALLVDGKTVWDGPPHARSATWNADGAEPGPHHIEVIVYDARGAVYRHQVNVMVAGGDVRDESPGNATEPPGDNDPDAHVGGDPGDPGDRTTPTPAMAVLVAVCAAALATVRKGRKV